MRTRPRYEARPVPFETDFERICEVVCGARCGDKQGALELTHILGIDTKVGLQGNFNAHALWHIDKAATAPHRAVERGEFIIGWGNNGAEMLFDDVGIQAQGCVHIGKDHAELLKVFAHFVIDSLTLVLCRYPCQVLLLSLRNTQSIKGVLDVCWDVVPGFPLLRDWLDIVVDIVEVNAREISAPGWHGTFLKEIKALEAECTHPSGFAFHLGDLLNDLRA